MGANATGASQLRLKRGKIEVTSSCSGRDASESAEIHERRLALHRPIVSC